MLDYGPKPLKYGTIVRVRQESRSSFYCKQGFVVRTDDAGNEDGPIRVWFGHECDLKLGWPRIEQLRKRKDPGLTPPKQDDPDDPRIFNFTVEDIVIEPEWAVDTLAERHWRRQCHSCYIPKEPFVTGKVCMNRNCEQIATRRIIFNIWGSVMSADVCETCAQKYHLCKMDDFPYKEKSVYDMGNMRVLKEQKSSVRVHLALAS